MKTIVSILFLCIFVLKIGHTHGTVNEASIELQCVNKSIYYYLCTNSIPGNNVTANTTLIITSVTGNYKPSINNSILKLTIRDGMLPSLPQKIADFFPAVIYFGAINCNLEVLKVVHFSRLKHLRILDLRHNKISFLPDDVFFYLRNLQKIDLSENSLSLLPNRLFTSMAQLKKVVVNDNIIRLFDSDVFQDNKNIEEVHLWQNEIRAIRFNANKMKKLKIFDVRGNSCIDKLFYIQEKITAAEIQRSAIDKCSSYIKMPGVLVYRHSREYRSKEHAHFKNSSILE